MLCSHAGTWGGRGFCFFTRENNKKQCVRVCVCKLNPTTRRRQSLAQKRARGKERRGGGKQREIKRRRATEISLALFFFSPASPPTPTSLSFLRPPPHTTTGHKQHTCRLRESTVFGGRHARARRRACLDGDPRGVGGRPAFSSIHPAPPTHTGQNPRPKTK